jgi:hypothetical protein
MSRSGTGTVFLGSGDSKNRLDRLLSGPASTPPTSPGQPSPPSSASPTQMTHRLQHSHHITPPKAKGAANEAVQQSVIDPVLSMELRLRWLEALLVGVKPDATKGVKGKGKAQDLPAGETIAQLAQDVERRLDGIVQSNEGLKRFMDHCEYAFFNEFSIRTQPKRVSEMMNMPTCLLLRLHCLGLCLDLRHHMRTCLP